MSDDRLTPNEIKAWCRKALIRYLKKESKMAYGNDDIVNLMYKAYKRCQMDERSG